MLLVFRAGVDLVLRWLTFALTGALLVCVMLGVVTRTLGNPLIWTDEVSRFLMVWVAAFGWMLASRRRAHIRIRFFQDLLPKQPKRAIELVIQCAVLVFGLLLFVFSIELVSRNHDLAALTVPISMSWLYAPIILAGLLTVIQAACEFIENAKTKRATPGPDEGLVE